MIRADNDKEREECVRKCAQKENKCELYFTIFARKILGKMSVNMRAVTIQLFKKKLTHTPLLRQQSPSLEFCKASSYSVHIIAMRAFQMVVVTRSSSTIHPSPGMTIHR